MTIRHAALAIAALLVLGLGVYLFIEVRATPASAQARPATPPPPAIDEETDPQPPAPPDPKQISRALPRLAAAEPGTREAPRAAPRLGALVRESPEDRAEASFPDPKLVAVMDEANKAYDRGDIDDAKAVAQKVLAKAPDNPRMLRIVVSASCIAGDSAEAEKSYRLLPKQEREQMKIRCARYGVTFKDE